MLPMIAAFIAGGLIWDVVAQKGVVTLFVWAWCVGLYRRLRHGRYGW